MKCKSKTEREIEDALRATGLPFEIRNGKKHKKVFLAGKLISVFSHGNSARDTDRLMSNFRADLRRIAGDLFA